MQFVGMLLAVFFLACAAVGLADIVSKTPRLPAQVRGAARRTVQGARNPARTARQARDSAGDAWARARAQNWLERKQAARTRRAARLPRTRPRVAITLPGVSDRPRQTLGQALREATRRTPATAAAAPPPEPPQPAPEPQSRQASPEPATTGRPAPMPATMRHAVPPDFASVIARIHGAEFESDREYLTFVRGLAAGFQGIAEALEEKTDHLLNGIGLDPAAVKCWHDISQSVAENAAGVTRAEGAYQSTYQGASEDASKGTVMPFRGRFITGEVA